MNHLKPEYVTMLVMMGMFALMLLAVLVAMIQGEIQRNKIMREQKKIEEEYARQMAEWKPGDEPIAPPNTVRFDY